MLLKYDATDHMQKSLEASLKLFLEKASPLKLELFERLCKISETGLVLKKTFDNGYLEGVPNEAIAYFAAALISDDEDFIQVAKENIKSHMSIVLSGLDHGSQSIALENRVRYCDEDLTNLIVENLHFTDSQIEARNLSLQSKKFRDTDTDARIKLLDATIRMEKIAEGYGATADLNSFLDQENRRRDMAEKLKSKFPELR